mgnify:FL=1
MIELKGFGNIKYHESIKSKLTNEKDLFIETIDYFYASWVRSNVIQNFGLDFKGFTNSYFVAIENLVYLKYGSLKGDIILWYIYERLDVTQKHYTPLVIELKDGERKEIIINNTEELWYFFFFFEEE